MEGDDIVTGGDEFEDMADIVEDMDAVEEETEGAEGEGVAKESRSTQFLSQAHPECRIDYVEDVQKKLPLNAFAPVAGKDPNHRSVPFLTQYERTKILGFRANQLSQGARPLIQVPSHVTDVMEIAKLELEQRRLPFLLKRPMPDGTYEYWRLADLMIL